MPVVRLTAEQASHILANGEVDLIDVREPHEWAQGHLPGARHVPLAVFLRNPRQHLQRQDRVMFVCGHGGRSLTAAAAAESHGCGEVYSIDGGTVTWGRLGFPLERG